MRQSKWLKLSEVLEQIGVSRSTFDMWRAAGNAPPTYVLPSGQLRYKQGEVDEWLESRVEYKGKGAA
jgi:predicted DNA-binding transcriptional regulator AlpA